MEDISRNVIAVDEDIIGYKSGIIKRIREELAYIATDEKVDNYYLSDLVELIKNIEEDKDVGDNTLLKVYSHPMGGFSYNEVEIVDVED